MADIKDAPLFQSALLVALAQEAAYEVRDGSEPQKQDMQAIRELALQMIHGSDVTSIDVSIDNCRFRAALVAGDRIHVESFDGHDTVEWMVDPWSPSLLDEQMTTEESADWLRIFPG